jgi:hypothetical protein
MMTAAELTRMLGGRWHGRYGTARCVIHDDRNPSLSIFEGDRGPTWKCFAGCDRRDIREELRRRGLLPPEPIEARRQPRVRPLELGASLWHESGPCASHLRGRAMTAACSGDALHLTEGLA